MLESAPIGTDGDNFFGEPDFSVPAEARRKHMALFGGTGTGNSTLLLNMAASDLAAGTGITVVDPHGGGLEGATGLQCHKIFIDNLDRIAVARDESVVYILNRLCNSE